MTGFSEGPRTTRVSGRVTNEAPSQPATTSRRFALTKKQVFGLPLIAAVPLLCLLGFFGESSALATAASPFFEVVIRYPSRES